MITRREWLALSAFGGFSALTSSCRRPGAGTASAATTTSPTGPAPRPGAPPCPPADVTTVIREVPRRPAAATFELSPTSALLWAYAPEPTSARIELSTHEGPPVPKWRSPAGPEPEAKKAKKTKRRARARSTAPASPSWRAPSYRRISTHRLELPAATGNTGVHQLEGLEPGRHYRYRLQFGNGLGTGMYEFRTPPTADTDAPLHFLFGADISNDPKYESPILRHMATSGADFYISLGDWPYTDIPIRDITVAQYRASHRVARLHPAVERLLRALPVYAIYDDHEIRDNWDKAFRDQDPERFHAGLEVWDEYFPVSDFRSDSLKRRRYRRWQWGKNAEFFMLDTRRYRSAYRDPDGPDKTMLGAEQLRWLEQGLRASRAPFKLILSSVSLDFGSTKEHWNAYRTERDAILDIIRRRAISGVIFLTSDQHWLSVHHHPGDIREFQIGPAQTFLRDPPDPKPDSVVYRARVPNYGEVVITGGKRPRLVFTARGKRGDMLYSEVVDG